MQVLLHVLNTVLHLFPPFLWMLLQQHPLCYCMCKVTKETLRANKIMRNAIDLISITLRWTSSSSRQSAFSVTLDRSQRLSNGGECFYLVKIGPKSLRDGHQNFC